MKTKEAIERVRSRFDKWALDNEDLTALQTLGLVDVESVESEDERIRKGLIQYLKELREWKVGTMVPIRVSSHYDAWIAYLEKQKEQTADNQFPPLEGLDAIKAKYYDKGFKCGFDEGIDSVKPTEWSDEDENNLELVIDCIYKFYPDPVMKYKLKEWLKSLRPSKDCSSCAKNLEGYISGRCDAENKLLEQFGALVTPEGELHIKPRWKPSEEQIGALNYAYCELFKRGDVGHNILGPLQNLIDTLTKL